MDGFASITSPLTTLTQKCKKFEWSEVCEKIFQLLNDRLSSARVLTLPEDINGFVLYCDTYRVALGCVVKQHGKVIAYGFIQPKVPEKLSNS